MKMKRWFAVWAGVGLLAGCTQYAVREGTHPPVTVPGPDTEVRYNNVSLLDDSLHGKIGIMSTGWNRTPTNTAQAWVQVRNRTDYFCQVEARTQFYDATQAPVDGPTAWQRVMLSPNSITTYRENSNRTDVAAYYVEIREGR